MSKPSIPSVALTLWFSRKNNINGLRRNESPQSIAKFFLPESRLNAFGRVRDLGFLKHVIFD